MLTHVLEVARAQGFARVSLETGTTAAFAAARALYQSAAFVSCGPFGGYQPSEDNLFMTLELISAQVTTGGPAAGRCPGTTIITGSAEQPNLCGGPMVGRCLGDQAILRAVAQPGRQRPVTAGILRPLYARSCRADRHLRRPCRFLMGQRLLGRRLERAGMGPAVVLGQGLADGAGPVGEVAVAELASRHRQMGNGHGEAARR
jgi:hypothetical protein